MNLHDHHISGKRFGRLVAIRMLFRNGRQQEMWECVCDCGNKNIVQFHKLIYRLSRSCGCLRNEALSVRSKKHGLSHTPEYRSWCAMRARCLRKGHKHYSNYGGRGITVCRAWKDSFRSFLSDMGEKPFPKAQLDRKDNDGNYTLSNCRWANKETQLRNTRANRIITIGNVSQPMICWAEQLGINNSTLHARLKAGWSEIKAVTKPLRSSPAFWKEQGR